MLEGTGHLGPKLWRVYCLRVTWPVSARAYNCSVPSTQRQGHHKFEVSLNYISKKDPVFKKLIS